MSSLLTLASRGFIGQMHGGTSAVMRGLAALRAPLILPRGVSAVLFENQPLLWVAAAALALILLQQGRSRANRTVFRTGVAVIAVTLAWIAAAAIFVTPAERLYRDHLTLATAAQNGDVHTIVSFFDNDFASPALGIDNPAQAKAQIERRLKSYGIKSIHLSNYHVDLYPPTATTKFTVIAETSEYPPVPTTWELTWVDEPGADWRIEKADLVRIGDRPASHLPLSGG